MAGNLESIDSVRALFNTEVNKLTNPQLKKALATLLDADRNEPVSNPVLTELREIKESIRELGAVKKEVNVLNNKLNSALQIIHQQQLFLESLDNKERRCNLVITGLSETADGIGNDDAEKLKTVLTKAKCPPDIDPSSYALRRLGQVNDHNKRPLHVTCSTQKQCDAIVAAARELNNAGETYSRIYIKKDIHPAVRKELGRLRKVAKDENEKADNEGCTIVFDHKNRVVTKDNVVIDRFTPKFF